MNPISGRLRPHLAPTLMLAVATLLVYGCFFQGWGFNQNAHFNTTRALIEHRSFEISPYLKDPDAPTFTMDVAEKDGRVYSNKPPGLPVVCVPVLAAARGIEAMLGVPAEPESTLGFNLYLMTLWGSGLPAVALVLAMYGHFRQRMSDADALLLSAAFAFGSFLLPYSGLLMVHTAVAAMLFIAWRLLVAGRAVLAGTLIGLAITFDISMAPLLFAYGCVAALSGGRRQMFAFSVGPILAICLIMVYQRVLFGGFLSTPHSFEKSFFINRGLFLGHFDWPDVRRIYWLTLHPLRGICYLCPIFVIPLLSPLVLRRRPNRDDLVPFAVIAYLTLFNLCFDGWTGGWGTAPRYLIPATPFIFIFAAPALRRFRKLCIALIVVSCINMLAITAYRAQYPSNTFGPPISDNPVVESVTRVRKQQLARDRGSFNWGLRAGLPGAWSLIPPLLLIAAPFACARRLTTKSRSTRSG